MASCGDRLAGVATKDDVRLFGAHSAAYTYIVPFLERNASLGAARIAAVLPGFGIVGFVANFAVSVIHAPSEGVAIRVWAARDGCTARVATVAGVAFRRGCHGDGVGHRVRRDSAVPEHLDAIDVA